MQIKPLADLNGDAKMLLPAEVLSFVYVEYYHADQKAIPKSKDQVVISGGTPEFAAIATEHILPRKLSLQSCGINTLEDYVIYMATREEFKGTIDNVVVTFPNEEQIEYTL